MNFNPEEAMLFFNLYINLYFLLSTFSLPPNFLWMDGLSVLLCIEATKTTEGQVDVSNIDAEAIDRMEIDDKNAAIVDNETIIKVSEEKLPSTAANKSDTNKPTKKRITPTVIN